MRLFTGQRLRVVAREIVGRELWRRGFIEPELTRVLLGTLTPGMVFIDIGAHYGYYPLVAAALLRAEASVFAFEPASDTFDLLRRNVAGIAGIRVEKKALHSRAGRQTLHDFGPSFSALNSLLRDAHVPAQERAGLPRPVRYQVDCITLDAYLARKRVVAPLIKIDAESMELEILKGARRTLERGVPLLTIETGDYDIPGAPTTRECIRYLSGLGYRAFEFNAGRLVPHRGRSAYRYGNLYFRRPQYSP